jgi:NADPH:quinone reductase-like Zn-dependent oxidoreductase
MRTLRGGETVGEIAGHIMVNALENNLMIASRRLSTTADASPTLSNRMKAVVYTEYGPPDVLHLTEVRKPTPKKDEVLIKMHATSVGFGDLTVRRFGMISPREFNMPLPMWLLGRMSFGFSRPKYGILGHEFAGEVDAVGEDVHRFETGDRVFGFLGDSMGGNAEYATVPEDGAIALLPAHVTYEEAAVLPYGAFIALNLLRKAKPRPGAKVLIIGASGGIGSAAVQLVKHYGAEVTGVAGTARLGFVRALGADHVIDYTAEDLPKTADLRSHLRRARSELVRPLQGVPHAERPILPGQLLPDTLRQRCLRSGR